MSDYISRAEAVAAIVARRDELATKKVYGWEWEYNGLNYAIQALPVPSADVAEVVRCRECDGWVATENSDLGLCALTKRVVTRRDYCSEGKRKDGDGNG